MTKNIPERVVVERWQQLTNRTDLTTTDGELIRIIYPGRKNNGRGADFRDAVIATSQGIIRGDIEVHVKSSDWQVHRHHQDPIYSQVKLHVVLWHDGKATTNLRNGKTAPILAIGKYLGDVISPGARVVPSPASLPCRKAINSLATDTLAQLLDSAGEERFRDKAAKFQAQLNQMESSQCLYQGIMVALGYAMNKLPMLKLASSLPFHRLKSVTGDKISDQECLVRLQALLLGTAGLLPSQRYDRRRGYEDDRWLNQLEELWAACGSNKAMSEDEWQLFKVRPNNFPPRRIAAMSYLILRYQKRETITEVVDMIKRVPVSKGYLRLEQGVIVTADGYWASHFDFGPDCRTNSPTLIGRWRAAAIAVNVLLPFALAWSELNCHPEIRQKAVDLYRNYPRLATNTLERHMMKQLRLNYSLINSAQRQQGLIHIYNTLCSQGRCNSCQLSQPEARYHVQV